MNILHITKPQKFTMPFFLLVERHFDYRRHAILTRRKKNDWPAQMKIASHASSGMQWMIDFTHMARKADKIILHSLLDFRVILMLALQPWLLKKCYWFIWGGDLYKYSAAAKGLSWHFKEMFRRPVIRRMGHLVTYIEGDVDLARAWYGAEGKYHECLLYPSNLYQHQVTPAVPSNSINIQIGNSANPSNNHLDVLDKLTAFKSQKIKIYAPLSYGNPQTAQVVASMGQAEFGSNFIALTDFLPFEKYLDFLGSVDIAIFNHKRQQAMGNTISLLGLGKKVYIRDDASPWQLFKRLGVAVYKISELDLSPIPEKESTLNQEIIRDFFSEQTLKVQLQKIFEG